MQFGDAITAMKNGLKVYRPKWDARRSHEPGEYLALEELDGPEGKFQAVRLFHPTVKGVASSWQPDHEDMLAEDWEIRQ